MSLVRRLRRLLFPALRGSGPPAAHEVEPALDLVYRFLLARSPDEGGRDHYLRLMREQGMTLREVAMEIAASDEFERRLRSASAGRAASPSDARPQPAPTIDAQELSERLSVEELARTADEYYRTTLAFTDGYLAKPFADPHDAPGLLGSFAHLLAGLRLARGMTVLDFGAGAGWTTRCLTQLGCAVIALDVSPTALQLGRELFARLPPVGNQPEPRFLVFDGRRIDLADASVDRIICFDAFHHVPNPAAVMGELGRVLRPGGVAGFSEPGPEHSKGARSQYEMKNYTAIEQDVVMADVWRWAQAAGFSRLELAVFSTESYRVPLNEFDDLVAGGAALRDYGTRLRAFLTGHQTFFLEKAGAAAQDSRARDGLKGEIAVRLDAAEIAAGEPIRGDATVLNVGAATWLPGLTPLGGVSLGAHLRARDGSPLAVDFRRAILETPVPPGGEQTLRFEWAPPEPGDYLLEFDLVSEGVAWFELNDSPTVTLRLTVGQ